MYFSCPISIYTCTNVQKKMDISLSGAENHWMQQIEYIIEIVRHFRRNVWILPKPSSAYASNDKCRISNLILLSTKDHTISILLIFTFLSASLGNDDFIVTLRLPTLFSCWTLMYQYPAKDLLALYQV